MKAMEIASRKFDSNRIRSLFDESQAAGLTPNATTLHILIQNSNSIKEAEELLDKFTQMQFVPTNRTYSALIKVS